MPRGAGRSSKVMPQPCRVLDVGRGKEKTCLKMAISRCHVRPPGAGAHLVQPVQV